MITVQSPGDECNLSPSLSLFSRPVKSTPTREAQVQSKTGLKDDGTELPLPLMLLLYKLHPTWHSGDISQTFNEQTYSQIYYGAAAAGGKIRHKEIFSYAEFSAAKVQKLLLSVKASVLYLGFNAQVVDT
ncbi:hypothetical protein JOB18_033391, partial [Solea senegalensis]